MAEVTTTKTIPVPIQNANKSAGSTNLKDISALKNSKHKITQSTTMPKTTASPIEYPTIFSPIPRPTTKVPIVIATIPASTAVGPVDNGIAAPKILKTSSIPILWEKIEIPEPSKSPGILTSANPASDVSNITKKSEIPPFPEKNQAFYALIGLILGTISLFLIVIFTTLVCLKKKRRNQSVDIPLKELKNV